MVGDHLTQATRPLYSHVLVDVAHLASQEELRDPSTAVIDFRFVPCVIYRSDSEILARPLIRYGTVHARARIFAVDREPAHLFGVRIAATVKTVTEYENQLPSVQIAPPIVRRGDIIVLSLNLFRRDGGMDLLGKRLCITSQSCPELVVSSDYPDDLTQARYYLQPNAPEIAQVPLPETEPLAKADCAAMLNPHAALLDKLRIKP